MIWGEIGFWLVKINNFKERNVIAESLKAFSRCKLALFSAALTDEDLPELRVAIDLTPGLSAGILTGCLFTST